MAKRRTVVGFLAMVALCCGCGLFGSPALANRTGSWGNWHDPDGGKVVFVRFRHIYNDKGKSIGKQYQFFCGRPKTTIKWTDDQRYSITLGQGETSSAFTVQSGFVFADDSILYSISYHTDFGNGPPVYHKRK